LASVEEIEFPSGCRSLHKEKQCAFENLLQLEKHKGKGKRKGKSNNKKNTRSKSARECVSDKMIKHESLRLKSLKKFEEEGQLAALIVPDWKGQF
jgi:hypothetical protein